MNAPAQFHGMPVNIIHHAGQQWLTAEQVGKCLGYADGNARKGINGLYNAHADEFIDGQGVVNSVAPLDTTVVKLTTVTGEKDTRIFSQTGCVKLGFFANTPRAKAFRQWAAQALVVQSTAHFAPVPAALPRVGYYVITRQIEFDTLSLFVRGWRQADIARHLRISKGVVSKLLHGQQRFSADAGQDLTTPDLIKSVVQRHMNEERARITKKYIASATNQALTHSLDASGQLLLAH